MKVVIVKYNAGNIRSVFYALKRQGIDAIISGDANEISTADKVIFPGVGEASSAMQFLRNNNLDKLIISLKQPVLGVCLGMQLMCESSEEGTTKCLGIFNTSVKRFVGAEKVPHVGWNSISDLQGNLFAGIPNESNVYFVHSYYAELCQEEIAQSNYINSFASTLHKNNFYGVQFHPEKSGKIGDRIISNFLNLI